MRKTELKFLEIFLINCFVYSDKGTIQLSCYEVSHLLLLFFKEIYSIISEIVVVSQCVGQQLTYKLGDLFIPKTKHSLVIRL